VRVIVVVVALALGVPAAAAAQVTIEGGTQAQRSLARLTAHRVGGPTLTRIAFRPPTRALRRGIRRGVVLAVESRRPDTLRGEWEEQLYAGTYLALSARWPRAAVQGVAAAHAAVPARRAPSFDVFSNLPTAVQVAEQNRLLFDRATRGHARIMELRLATAPARAVTLVVRADDPAAFLKHHAQAVLDLLNKPRIHLIGYYVGLQDAGGHLVWAASRLPNMGGVFVIPRLDACNPILHSVPVGAPPPPACPAR
jgi:hypothetical protein